MPSRLTGRRSEVEQGGVGVLMIREPGVRALLGDRVGVVEPGGAGGPLEQVAIRIGRPELASTITSKSPSGRAAG